MPIIEHRPKEIFVEKQIEEEIKSPPQVPHDQNNQVGMVSIKDLPLPQEQIHPS